MNLSAKTLEKLVEIITGNSKQSPYRSGPQLIEFFYDFGERDLYGQSFPARHTYALEKLKKLNGTELMQRIVTAAFDFFEQTEFNPESAASEFNRVLTRDGYRLIIEYGPGWMNGNEYQKGAPHFEVRPLTAAVVVPQKLVAISHEAINEQVAKANSRIESGDCAGAIASAYTLVEHLLKLILREAGSDFKENEGDIRSLYPIARNCLNLDPAGDTIEAPLKPILEGLQKLVRGLYEISNKASDRHARRYNPSPHHAKLAISAAFALCEFLVETRAYQASRPMKKVS